MSQTRQLAAIMFTDIVGYTALMGKDEDKALAILRKSRSLQQKNFNAHNGSLLKEMGDGMLVQFRSAKEAVLCAISIQQEAQTQLEASIRIGIHLGDVTIENGDIFGDGVNIASRLQSHADPGGIYISDSVYKAVQAIPSIRTAYLGDIDYKNVKHPVATYAIQGSDFPVPVKTRLPKKTSWARTGKKLILPLIVGFIAIYIFRIYYSDSALPNIESIAVLPFENLTSNEDKEVFIAGMHDALIAELGRINSLRVISKTSTLRYKNSDQSLAEIAEELDVDAIVEASVLQADSLVNLQASLIRVFPKEHSLWSNTITRDFTHILEIYRSITHNIVEEIKITIRPESRNRLTESIIVNPDAYTAYINGRHFLGSLSKEGLDKALEYFLECVRHDPNYAPAYGGIASVWAYRQQIGYASRDEALNEIETNLTRALSLESDLAESYYSKAVVEAWTNWNWYEAEKAFQEALSINPNLAEAHAFYSHLLMCLKRPVEMKMHMEQAVDLDPFNPLIQMLEGVEFAISKQAEKAITRLKPLDQLVPNSTLVQIGMWTAYHVKGSTEEAFQKQKRILELVSRDELVVQVFEETFLSKGYQDAMRAAADLWAAKADSTFVPPDNIYWLYAAAGDEQKTLEWLERGFEMHDSNMPYVAVLPFFSLIQDNPQYLNLLDRLNLPGN